MCKGVKTFVNPEEFNLNKIDIIEDKKLSKYCNTFLIDNYYRDLSIYNKENEFLVTRCWIDYNQKEKFLKIVNVYETLEYKKDIEWYLEFINNTTYIPNFTDNKDFLFNLNFINNKDFIKKNIL